MKRAVVFILAMLLIPAWAVAETRVSTIPIEGLAEEITETKVTGTKGYTIFMDLERYELLEEDEGGGFDQFVPIGEGYASEMKLSIDFSNALSYTAEDAAADTAAVYNENGFENVEIANIIDFPEEYDAWSVIGTSEGELHKTVLIGMDHGIYSATISCPLEAAEGFGQRMMLALYTLEPVIE